MISACGGFGDDVGRVEAAAEPDLDDRHVGRMFGEQQEGDGGQDLEDGDRLAAIGFCHPRDGVGEHRHRPPAARRPHAASR